MEWVEKELECVDFGDDRLNARGRKILSQFYDKPNSSINGSFNGWSETKASYRFFDNKNVSAKKILSPHQKMTVERIKQLDVVLCVQDTTIIDYSHRKKPVEGLGKLRLEKEQGLLLHPTAAFSNEGVCLGVMDYKTWIRKELQGKKSREIVKPVEEKESMRWLESYRMTDEIAKNYPDKLFINIADREGDFYELLQEYDKTKTRAHIIVRAKSNRVLDAEGDQTVKKLWEKLQQQPVIGTVKFELSEIDGKRKAREVSQTIRTCEVSFSPPRKRRKLNELRPIKIQAVLCTEEKCLIGEEPIEWLLLTSLDINGNKSKALEIIKYYQIRWQIELYFKTLKSGCGIEKLQLDNIDRLENAIAFYMIVAWRIMFLSYLGRVCPNISCEPFYGEDEWKAIYIIANRTNPPNAPPSLDSVNRMVASFGGFLNRKSDKEPGIKTMWIGLGRLRDFTLAFELFKAINTYG